MTDIEKARKQHIKCRCFVALSFLKLRQPRVKSELPVKPEKAFEMTGCALSGGAHPRPATCQDSLISRNYAESEFPPCLIRLSTAVLMKGRSWSPLSETMTADAKSAATRVGKTQLEGSSVWIYVRPSCDSSDGSVACSVISGGAVILFNCVSAGCEA